MCDAVASDALRFLITAPTPALQFQAAWPRCSHQVELLIGCKGRLWCGGLKSFHDHSLARAIEASDWRESAGAGAFGSLISVMEG